MTGTWRLRRATAGDEAACGLVATASFAAAFYDDVPLADMLAHCAANCSASKFTAWLADASTVVTLAEYPDTGVPVGYSVLTTPDLPIDPIHGDVELRRIYLMPVGWGTGLAANLLARAVEDARGQGRRRMLLGVYDRNERALRFYRKQGFEQVGTRQFRVGATLHDDFIYALRL